MKFILTAVLSTAFMTPSFSGDDAHEGNRDMGDTMNYSEIDMGHKDHFLMDDPRDLRAMDMHHGEDYHMGDEMMHEEEFPVEDRIGEDMPYPDEEQPMMHDENVHMEEDMMAHHDMEGHDGDSLGHGEDMDEWKS